MPPADVERLFQTVNNVLRTQTRGRIDAPQFLAVATRAFEDRPDKPAAGEDLRTWKNASDTIREAIGKIGPDHPFFLAVPEAEDCRLRHQNFNRAASALPDEEWLAERAKYALLVLRECVEVSPGKHGGVPVLRGTRFTVAQVFAEAGEGRSLPEIAADFNLDAELLKNLMDGFSIHLDRPLAT